MTDARADSDGMTNGAAMAAFVAAGIGTFAMGLLVILNEAGIFAAPALYPPAGGVTGRTGIAVAVWLIAWALLHRRWKSREIAAHRTYGVALALTAAGILLTFPPVWSLL